MKKVLCAVTNDLVQDARMKRVCNALCTSGYLSELIGRERPGSLPFVDGDFQWHRMKCFFAKGPLFYAEYNARLFFQILKRKPDIIYAVDVDTLGACMLAGRIRRTPVVYDAHEYFSETPELESKPFRKQIWKWLEKILIPGTNQAITVSAALAELLEKRYGKVFSVVRNIPESLSESFKGVEERQNGLIYYQGVLNAGRGLEQMIDAMQFLPDLRLCIAGEGDLSERLRLLAAQSPASARIKFVGWQSHAGLNDLAKKAWIGINLLDGNSLSYRYSLANKTFDYIRAGLPALHMNFPEYQSLVTEYRIGWVTENLHPEMLAGKLLQIYNNPDSWNEVRQNCIDAAQRLTWENESERLMEVFDRL